jgi:glycosyltransferase involved in cell wall biosynthesis
VNAARQRICLSMIVRNEARTIKRCLSAARPLIDAAVICDTGSTDDTIAHTKRWLQTAGIPSAVVEHAWQDFGTNRTTALREAGAFVTGLDWDLQQTYWLLLDADLELVIENGFDPQTLRAHAIALRQEGGGCVYWNLRLAKAHLPWRAVGPTHEYYDCGQPGQGQRLEGLWIRDHGDGGSKGDKFSRDIALLNEALARDPGNPRTLFYLAQSYRATGDRIRALALYHRRIAAGGWHEEVWYSKYAIGLLHAGTGAVDAATAAFLDAQAADPARAEPLCELARLYRHHDRFEEAASFAERGRQIPFPSERWLFVHRDIYDYGLDLELARTAWRTADPARGFDACERLALSREVPEEVAAEARRLVLSYVRPLEGVEFLRLNPALPPHFQPCNPAVLRSPSGYLVNCRAVNFEQRHLRYRIRDGGPVYRTCNVLLDLDEAFRVVREQPVTIDEPPLRVSRIQGLEDVRLIRWRDRLLAICATADRHPSGHVHQSLCELDASGRVISHEPLVGSLDGRTQKNWLPFEGPSGELQAIYGYAPLTILTICPRTGRYEVACQIESPVRSEDWRGSAPPIAWPGPDGTRRLVLIHQAVDRRGYDGRWERVYLHRFVEYDESFALQRASRPFVFGHQGVEYSCGMTLDHARSALIVAIAIEDGQAWLCRVPVARVEAELGSGYISAAAIRSAPEDRRYENYSDPNLMRIRRYSI